MSTPPTGFSTPARKLGLPPIQPQTPRDHAKTAFSPTANNAQNQRYTILGNSPIPFTPNFAGAPPSPQPLALGRCTPPPGFLPPSPRVVGAMTPPPGFQPPSPGVVGAMSPPPGLQPHSPSSVQSSFSRSFSSNSLNSTASTESPLLQSTYYSGTASPASFYSPTAPSPAPDTRQGYSQRSDSPYTVGSQSPRFFVPPGTPLPQSSQMQHIVPVPVVPSVAPMANQVTTLAVPGATAAQLQTVGNLLQAMRAASPVLSVPQPTAPKPLQAVSTEFLINGQGEYLVQSDDGITFQAVPCEKKSIRNPDGTSYELYIRTSYERLSLAKEITVDGKVQFGIFDEANLVWDGYKWILLKGIQKFERPHSAYFIYSGQWLNYRPNAGVGELYLLTGKSEISQWINGKREGPSFQLPID